MAITLNGIVFNNTSKIGTGTAIKLLKNGAAGDMAADIADGITGDQFANNYGAVQSLNINWNGAQLGDKTLNTTGEVLSSYKVAI